MSVPVFFFERRKKNENIYQKYGLAVEEIIADAFKKLSKSTVSS